MLLHELRTRNVIPWTLGYLAGAGGLIQLLQFLVETYSWPNALLRVVPMAAAGGALIAVTIAWFHGAGGRQRIVPREIAVITLTMVLTVSFGLVLVRRQGPSPASRAATTTNPGRVLVLPLENATGDRSLASLGSIAADWITEGLLRAGTVQVVDPQTALMYARPDGRVDARAAARNTGAGTVVTGRYYVEGTDLLFAVRVIGPDGTILDALRPIRSATADPSAGVQLLRGHVLAALASRYDARLQGFEAASAPPIISSYEAYVQGIEEYLRLNFQEAAALFDRAFQQDSSFVRAAIWSFAAHSFADEFMAAVQAKRRVERNLEALGPYDLHHFRFFEAVIAGDHARAYEEARAMMTAAPGSEDAVREAILSAQRARRVHAAIELMSRLDFTRPPLSRYMEMWVIRTNAFLFAGNTAGAERIAQTALKLYPDAIESHMAMAKVAAKVGKGELANHHIDVVLSQFREHSLLYVDQVIHAGTLLAQVGDSGAARSIFEHTRTAVEATAGGTARHAGTLAELSYLLEDTARARRLAHTGGRGADAVEQMRALTVRGALAARAGKREQALAEIRKMQHIQTGNVMVRSQGLARIYALLGDATRAAALLSDNLDNDAHPDFNPIRGSSVFQAAVSPK